jgi:hypothetical protein
VHAQLVDKSKQLPADIKWHFIGHLQSNKCRKLLEAKNLHVVESVDSLKLATQLNKACESLGVKQLNILIQVNTSGEDSKFGCEPKDCVQLATDIAASCKNLKITGLMTIGAYEAAPTSTFFNTLVGCKQEVLKALPQLDEQTFQMSMGMSHDFELALANGSTEVRVGSAIFGSRVYADKYKDKDKEDDKDSDKGSDKEEESKQPKKL